MNPFDQETKQDGLQLSNNSLGYLESTAKWARFLAILGFIGLGLMVIAALIMFVMGAAISGRTYGRYGGGMMGFPAGLVGVSYLIMAVLYFFPILYLNNYATRMLQAIAMRDSAALESSFEQLRNHYRFVGILTIVVIGLYLLALLIGLMAGAANGFR